MTCPFCGCPRGAVDPELLPKVQAGKSWLPISTFPKNERGEPKPGEVLLKLASGITVVGHWMPGGFCIEDHPSIEAGWYTWAGSMFDLAHQPTHWMPLP